MKDYLIRGIAYNDQVRIFACSTTDALNYIGVIYSASIYWYYIDIDVSNILNIKKLVVFIV